MFKNPFEKKLKEIKLKDPNEYSKLKDINPIKKSSDIDEVGSDDLIQYVYLGLSAATPNQEILGLINNLKLRKPKELKNSLKSVKKSLKEFKNKIKREESFSNEERGNFATDVLLGVCIEHVLDGTPIPITGITKKEN
ncbi:hypothetical protein N9948_00555 [bacterium]|nr:hypothetical protein [bacterium]